MITTPEVVQQLKEIGEIETTDHLDENQYLEVRSEEECVLGVHKQGKIIRVPAHTVSGIKPRNKEQVWAIDALVDRSISVVTLTGTSGSGKTLVSLAAALYLLDKKYCKRIILSRPMSQVGKYKLGALPGIISDKVYPFLLNFSHNLEKLCGRRLEDVINQYRIEVVPLQLIRGASFDKSFIIVDECQVLPPLEVLTIGTRVGEKTKLVLMGDMDQRDEKIKIEETGLHKLINSPIARASSLFSSIHLTQCERSETARLFTEIFK